ncbi:hypothetical protein CRUP_029904 [Coryphaenoides rupestris]|nr:hypothetical protein CRUP_029904 [Coryphaenoides rupestris]
MEAEEDRVELRRAWAPRSSVEEPRHRWRWGSLWKRPSTTIYHIQSACQIQVAALCSAGVFQNLILLDRTTQRPNATGTVGWAGSTFGPLTKSRLGRHEFEALMRTMDNLGYRTGYAYRFPVMLERTRTRREVEVPASAISFHHLEEEGGGGGFHHLGHHQQQQQPHSQRQQQERCRWLNTPNTYQKWLKTEEVTQAGSTSIKMERSQFVPLFTNPKEVLETLSPPKHPPEPEPPNPFNQLTDNELEEYRKEIRQQNRQDMKTAGPQSQVLASVTDNSPPSPVSPPKHPPEPEPPNPFNQLTDNELEEYRKEVQRKQGGDEEAETAVVVPAVVQNGGEEEGEEEKQMIEELEKGMKALSTEDATITAPSSTPTAPPAKPPGGTPEGSPGKSPSQKEEEVQSTLVPEEEQEAEGEGEGEGGGLRWWRPEVVEEA